MLVPGKYRHGYALWLIAAAVAIIAMGGVLTYAAFAELQEASVVAPWLIPHLTRIQDVVVATGLASLVVALTAALVLAGSEWMHRRNADELLRHLEAFRQGDWHPVSLPDGSELGEIAAAVDRLGTATRREGTTDEAEEVKTKFLEIISHQLRTPLTAVRWNLEALLKGDLGPVNRRQEDILRITNKNYQNILVMLSDWVEALEIERGLLQLNMEPVDLGEFIEALLPDVRAQATLKDQTVRVTVARKLPKVMADKLKLRYVFMKLLHNAIAYTPDGGSISVRAREEKGRVAVDVHDNGVGIPLEEQGRIFKKFFRASNATLMQPNASGVGLFVTKVLIEAHGGEIGFASEEGKGTVFSFTLPAHAAAPKRRKAV